MNCEHIELLDAASAGSDNVMHYPSEELCSTHEGCVYITVLVVVTLSTRTAEGIYV